MNSLIFNDEVDAYKSWTLFLIFVSILVLISGVVLLTHKKPEATIQTPTTAAIPRRGRGGRRLRAGRGEGQALRIRDSEDGEDRDEDQDGILWAVGDVSDEDGAEPLPHHNTRGSSQNLGPGVSRRGRGEESVGLMAMRETGPGTGRTRSLSRGRGIQSGNSEATLLGQGVEVPFRDTPETDSEEFGRWETSGVR